MEGTCERAAAAAADSWASFSRLGRRPRREAATRSKETTLADLVTQRGQPAATMVIKWSSLVCITALTSALAVMQQRELMRLNERVMGWTRLAAKLTCPEPSCLWE